MRRATAMQCTALGGPENLVERQVDLPAPGPGEVRLRLRAAGINFADILLVAGKYQLKAPLPFTPGFEGAGEVAELGAGVSDLVIGQPVAVMVRPTGCYATGLVTEAERVVPLPAGLDLATAAGLPIAYGTAHLALTRRGALKAGETLLVTGAAGGVGLAAVEVGKALGARVIAAGRGADRLAVATAHGADEVIDYAREDLRERVKALTGGRGADVILETVGGDVFDACLRAINWEGRILVVGFASGRIPSAPANLVLVKNFSIVGVEFGAHLDRHPNLIRESLSQLFAWWTEGRLQPAAPETFPLTDAPAALRRLAERTITGKAVLVM